LQSVLVGSQIEVKSAAAATDFRWYSKLPSLG
jgi:hypothetical protein